MMYGEGVPRTQMQLKETIRTLRISMLTVHQAMINLYKLDKSYVTKYLSAACRNNIVYTDRSLMARGKFINDSCDLIFAERWAS